MRRREFVRVALVGVAPALVLATWPGGSARADEITDWNAIALQQVLNSTGVSQPRIMAMMGLAQFDALNSITPQYNQYSGLPTFLPNAAGASPQAAADQAAYAILLNAMPGRQADLDAALASHLATIPDGAAKTAGINVGNAAAQRMISLRANDHTFDVVPYTPGSNPGDWRPTGTAQLPAANAQWPLVTPFTIKSASQFRNPNGPPALTSAAFATAVNEVRDIGSSTSTTRTQAQTDTAKFWYTASGTTNAVPGIWNRAAVNTLQTHPQKDLVAEARLMALLNMAEHDDFIGSNDDKYHYNFWRPETAIHMADTYNNPQVAKDANWTPFLVAPPFPSYVSNHASLDGAAAEILKEYYGTDNITFTVGTQGFVLPDRTYTNFSDAALEGALSRIYAGIHYRFDSDDGLVLGRDVGGYVFANELQPIVPDPAGVTLCVLGGAGLLLTRRRPLTVGGGGRKR
ncbi:MAG TPA: vanadium-dependent haloperoxidase [Tepidisphaeraceae bacterium]